MIDIKTLGSHVLVNGERRKVKALSYGPWVFLNEDSYNNKLCHINMIEPIPITPELLTELGFKQSENINRDWTKNIGDDLIFIHFLLNGKMARVFTSGESVEYGNCLCRYLHELETFVLLTIHKELIEV